MDWLKPFIPKLSPKRKELFSTFFFNFAVACFAVGAFEENWVGIICGLASFWAGSKISKEL